MQFSTAFTLQARRRRNPARLLFPLLLAASMPVSAEWRLGQADSQLWNAARSYLKGSLSMRQPDAYFTGIELERHDRFYDNSPAGLSRFRQLEDQVRTNLKALDAGALSGPRARAFHAAFLEEVEGSVATRVCKSELWNVSHMGGPHTMLDLLVNYQPVDSPAHREQALARWSGAAQWFRREITNLEAGLEQGLSAPKRVVDRVVKQLDALADAPPEQHPWAALAGRSDHAAFDKAFKELLETELIPAVRAYRDYLAGDYRKRARDALGLHALPDGRTCYMARYRSYTTLQRTPQEVFDTGMAAVERHRATVVALGREIYGTDGFEATLKAANADESQRFASAEQMQAFYEELVQRSRAAMPRFFSALPSTPLRVEPIPEHQQGSGRSAHYLPGSDDRPGTFAYDPTTYDEENFGTAEIVTVHEGYPGHHMQIGLAQDLPEFHPLQRALWNSAYGEGWARYAEHLAEEAGLYRSKSARILRRAWPARGMVADPALHLLGWSNGEVAAFLAESGRPDIAGDTDALLDRMAALPAQLTSYDSGALEIFALRAQMRETLGEAFDLREFHRLVLMNGPVPLAFLRQQVTEGMMATQAP